MYDSKEYHKDYYENNKEKLNKLNREYYHLNKVVKSIELIETKKRVYNSLFVFLNV